METKRRKQQEHTSLPFQVPTRKGKSRELVHKHPLVYRTEHSWTTILNDNDQPLGDVSGFKADDFTEIASCV